VGGVVSSIGRLRRKGQGIWYLDERAASTEDCRVNSESTSRERWNGMAVMGLVARAEKQENQLAPDKELIEK
jgi:hypothetical protein